MQKIIKLFLVILLSVTSQKSWCQFPSFEIKTAVEKQDKNYIIYETAVWCKPCMDGLHTIIDSFKNEKNYKLVIWFERTYLSSDTQSMGILKRYYGDSLFYFFPKRYYDTKYRLIAINPENKVLKRIMNELNETGKIKLEWKKMGWGRLFLINKTKVLYTSSLKKYEQIKEIKENIKQSTEEGN